MKTLRLIVVTMVFAGLLAVSAMAQAPTGKIGLVNMSILGAKGGITKYISALDRLDAEFKKDGTDLTALGKVIQVKESELQTLAKKAQEPNSPISRQSVIDKAGELDKLKRDAKFKQEDIKARFGARQQVVIGPIYSDIMKALQEYATQKGYALILDGAKLEQQGMLMAFDNKYDVTKDFIGFFNKRPAGSATK